MAEKINTKHSLSNAPRRRDTISTGSIHHKLRYITIPSRTTRRMTHGVHAGGISGQMFRVKKSRDFYRRTLPFVLDVVFKRGVTRSGVYHALKYGAWTDRLINGHSVREFISVDNPLTFTLDPACRRGQKRMKPQHLTGFASGPPPCY
jgi:hypothetical protein